MSGLAPVAPRERLGRGLVGPLEWLWRTAVYLNPQPMRTERNAAHSSRS